MPGCLKCFKHDVHVDSPSLSHDPWVREYHTTATLLAVLTSDLADRSHVKWHALCHELSHFDLTAVGQSLTAVG